MYTATGTLDKQHYINKYSPLVKRIAHHMMARLPASVQIGDLMQAGLMGLLDAAARYEEEQGVQFETYASQRIRAWMRRFPGSNTDLAVPRERPRSRWNWS
jgi:RNA polymerase sigma factor FliA